jgi:hypothetical protein
MSWTRSGSHGRSIYGKAQPEASRTERDRGTSSSTPAGRPVARVSENSRLRARGCGGGERMSRGRRYVSAPVGSEADCGRRAASGGADGYSGVWRMGVVSLSLDSGAR